jgi:hypothetical protein
MKENVVEKLKKIGGRYATSSTRSQRNDFVLKRANHRKKDWVVVVVICP